MRQGFADKFSKQLSSFKTTRKFITQKSQSLERDSNDLSEAEKALRRGFTWQQRLTEVLLKYADTVSTALLNIGCAHEELVNAGAAEAGIETMMLEALLQSFAEAQRLCSEVANRLQRPLEAHTAGLVACAKQVREADEFATELKHYRDKVDGLKEQKRAAVKKARES